MVSVSSVEDYGPAQPPLPFCAASYPATLDAGTLIATVPGRGPAPLQPQNQNGLIGYQAAASVGAIQAGEYSISTAAGGTVVGPFAAEAILPSPIAITTDLRPGTPIGLPFTLNWTGGGAESVVTVELKVHIPGDPPHLSCRPHRQPPLGPVLWWRLPRVLYSRSLHRRILK